MRSLIESIKIDDTRVVVVADESLKPFIHDDFFAEYYGPGIEGRSLNKSTAIIPFLYNIAPVIWLTGGKYTVDDLDENCAKSLTTLRAVFRRMYPSYAWDGEIVATNTVKSYAQYTQNYNAAVLFSGGVDSVYSSLYNRDKKQALVTVFGADIALDNTEGRRNVESQTQEFADIFAYETIFIETNFRKFLNINKLESMHPEISSWWGGVQHGMAFVGLVAPIISQGSAIIAATHTPSFNAAWGSGPEIDQSCSWGEVSVYHHGYDAPRQQKIDYIVKASRELGESPLLRVCYANPFGGGDNCTHCEKCLRTFAGLVAAGANPKDFGINISLAEGAGRIKRSFAKYRIPMAENEKWMWQDIQKGAMKLLESVEKGAIGNEEKKFLIWLKQYDIDSYYVRNQKALKRRKQMIRFAKKNLVIEKAIRKVVLLRNRMFG